MIYSLDFIKGYIQRYRQIWLLNILLHKLTISTSLRKGYNNSSEEQKAALITHGMLLPSNLKTKLTKDLASLIKNLNFMGDSTDHHIFPGNNIAFMLRKGLNNPSGVNTINKYINSRKGVFNLLRSQINPENDENVEEQNAIEDIFSSVFWYDFNLILGPQSSNRSDDPGQKIDSTLLNLQDQNTRKIYHTLQDQFAGAKYHQALATFLTTSRQIRNVKWHSFVDQSVGKTKYLAVGNTNNKPYLPVRLVMPMIFGEPCEDMIQTQNHFRLIKRQTYQNVYFAYDIQDSILIHLPWPSSNYKIILQNLKYFQSFTCIMSDKSQSQPLPTEADKKEEASVPDATNPTSQAKEEKLKQDQAPKSEAAASNNPPKDQNLPQTANQQEKNQKETVISNLAPKSEAAASNNPPKDQNLPQVPQAVNQQEKGQKETVISNTDEKTRTQAGNTKAQPPKESETQSKNDNKRQAGKKRYTGYRLQEKKQIQFNYRHLQHQGKLQLIRQIGLGLLGRRRFRRVQIVCSLNQFFHALRAGTIFHKSVSGLSMIVELQKFKYTTFDDENDKEGIEKEDSLFRITLTRYPTEKDRQSYGFNEALQQGKITAPFQLGKKGRKQAKNRGKREKQTEKGRQHEKSKQKQEQEKPYNRQKKENQKRKQNQKDTKIVQKRQKDEEFDRPKKYVEKKDQAQRKDRTKNSFKKTESQAYHQEKDKRQKKQDRNEYEDKRSNNTTKDQKVQNYQGSQAYKRGQTRTRGTGRMAPHNYDASHIRQDRREREDRGQRAPKRNNRYIQQQEW